MKKQQGAALIVVMSLLAVSLTLGLMNIQTSQVDERLAGNYRASALAQMAAEQGAAYGLRALDGNSSYFDGYFSDEGCDELVGQSSSELEIVGPWYDDVDDVDAKIIRCLSGQDQQLHLSWGRVTDSGGAIIAVGFVAFDRVGSGGFGGAWPPSLGDVFKDSDGVVLSEGDVEALSENTLLVGGVLDWNQNASEVIGPWPRSGLPDWAVAVPDPAKAVEWARAAVEAGNSAVVESCDADFSAGDATVVFCGEGGFSDDIDERLSGMLVIVDGAFTGSNVKDDVDVYLISSGSMSLFGFGNNTISGGVWVGGALSVQGRSNFCGSVVVRGSASFDGRSDFDIESDGCVPGGGGASDDNDSGGSPGDSSLIWRSL